MNKPKIYIGADHRGFESKNKIKEYLELEGYEVEDKGAYEHDPLDDYPKFGIAVGEGVSNDPNSFGILVCGSSIGVTVAANKVKGIFASNPRTVEEAIEDKEHHGGNVLALSADNETLVTMMSIIKAWIETEPLGGKYEKRSEMIREYEGRS